MADLTDLQASQNVKIAGASATGVETNFVDATSDNRLKEESVLLGATTATRIGNNTDRLKVDNSHKGANLRIVDMNASSGGVARETSISSTTIYTTIFDYSGSGSLFNFLITLEGNLTGADPYNIKLEIDGNIVFEVTTLDIGTAALYNLLNINDEFSMGIAVSSNTFRFNAPKNGSVYYNSNVKISIKKAAGGAKKFRAGMIYMTKDT